MSTFSSSLLKAAASMAYGVRGPVRLPILMFHRILDRQDPLQPGVPDAALADLQFKVLRELFTVVPMAEAVQQMREGRLKPRTISLTFDDGYRDNHDIALPLLQRHGLNATFFVASGFLDGGIMFNDMVIESVRRMPAGGIDLTHCGLGRYTLDSDGARVQAISEITRGVKHLAFDQRALVCEALAAMVDSPLPRDLMMTTDQVRAMVRQGMDIGGHTVHHPILQTVDDATAQQEIIANRAALEQITGRAPATFAYPNGKPGADYTGRHAEMVREAGYSCAVATAYGVADPQTDPFQIPRLVLSKTTYPKIVLQLLRASSYVVHGSAA